MTAEVGLEEVGHTHSERGGAAGAGNDGVLANVGSACFKASAPS